MRITELFFNEYKIGELFNSNLSEAKELLSSLDIFCGNDINIKGLNGWVFEQTVQYCIRKELELLKIQAKYSEQEKIHKRGASVDLVINNIAIEIKKSGLFCQADIAKYEKYKEYAIKQGFKEYLFISGVEEAKLYRAKMQEIIGLNNTFFLDIPNEWNRFMNRLIELL